MAVKTNKKGTPALNTNCISEMTTTRSTKPTQNTTQTLIKTQVMSLRHPRWAEKGSGARNGQKGNRLYREATGETRQSSREQSS